MGLKELYSWRNIDGGDRQTGEKLHLLAPTGALV